MILTFENDEEDLNHHELEDSRQQKVEDEGYLIGDILNDDEDE
jgi:hypothetical protein